MCNFAHVYKIVCIVPCNFQIYKGIIIISELLLKVGISDSVLGFVCHYMSTHGKKIINFDPFW